MVRRVLYIIIGAIVVVLILIGVGVFVLLPKITSANSPQATPTPVVSSTATPTKGNAVTAALKQYAPNIRSQMAQGLHLTTDQLATQLRSGKTLTQVATAQGVSATQLQSLISNAVTTSLQPAVDGGTLTQKQVDALVKRYQKNPALLDKMLGGKAVKSKATATPTAGQ